MTRHKRHRRASAAPDQPDRPFYARALRLRHLRPSWWLCFLYFEGMIALGVLLALAELVEWWGVLVLPGLVALMVKLNDLVAGATDRRRALGPRAAGHRPAAPSGVVGVAAPAVGRASASATVVKREAAAAGAAPPPAGTAAPGPATASVPAGRSRRADPDALRTRPARQFGRDPVNMMGSVRSPIQRFRQSAVRRYH